MLRRAVENGALARNVAAIRKPPVVDEKEIEILSADEVSADLAALQGHSIYPIAFLAATGMRRGELGLEWHDVDLDRGALRVERSLEETKAGPEDQGAQDETRPAQHRDLG